VFGITSPADDAVPPQLIRYLAGIPAPDDYSGQLADITVAPGAYFAVTYEGTITNFDDAVGEIYGDVFNQSGYQFRDGLHLEMYPSDWDPQNAHSRMDVLIPILANDD